MTTHGGSYMLTPDGLEYTPKPIVTSAMPARTVVINPAGTPYPLTVDRAFANPPFNTRPMRKRRKAKPAQLKRRSSATAIGSTRSWTGITEWGMIPATKEMQAVFDAERALKRLTKNDPAEKALAKLERAFKLTN